MEAVSVATKVVRTAVAATGEVLRGVGAAER